MTDNRYYNCQCNNRPKARSDQECNQSKPLKKYQLECAQIYLAPTEKYYLTI